MRPAAVRVRQSKLDFDSRARPQPVQTSYREDFVDEWDAQAQRFTAADVSVGYALLLAQHLGLSERFTPAVQAYWHRLQQREAYGRAMQAQHAAAVAQGVSTVPAPDTR